MSLVILGYFYPVKTIFSERRKQFWKKDITEQLQQTHKVVCSKILTRDDRKVCNQRCITLW